MSKADEIINEDQSINLENGLVKDEIKESSTVISPVVEAKPRFYYVDWIRAIAIHLVIFIHAINMGVELRNHHFPKTSYKN